MHVAWRFHHCSPKWAANVELLRLRGADLVARGAFLNLQDHGDPVWYRGIKLRELGPDEKLDRTPVTPATISAEALKIEKEKLQRILDRRKQQKTRPRKNPQLTDLGAVPPLE